MLKKILIKKLNQAILIRVSLLAGYATLAQDLEPRSLSSMPIGTNVAVASYAFSSGNIMLDKTLPIENLESELNSIVFAYARSFKLFNKLTKVDAVVPYAFADFSDSFRLGLAGSYELTKKLNWELRFNSWYFTKSSSIFNGNTVKQKPLISLQTHFPCEFKPSIWAAVSFGKSNLGETVLNRIEKNDIQKNTRTGLAFPCQLHKNYSLKIAATTGVTTRYGSDYTTVMLAYRYLWFEKPKSLN